MKLSLPFLQSFGLTENEISLYELLLKLGESPASTIISEAKLKRPTVYKTLYSLEKKGLVEQKKTKTKIHFSPLPPTVLSTLAESQYQELDRARENLQTALPTLLSQYTTAADKPIVRVYEGINGIKEIYKDTLKENQTIYAVARIETLETELHTWLQNTYVKQRAKQKIHAKVIIASDKVSKQFMERDINEFRTTIAVPGSQFPFEHEVNIYGDKVAFINNHKDAPLLGLIITNPLIAKTMKAWFDLAWLGAESTGKD